MPEPSTSATAIASMVSAVSIALFGVDYYSILYAFVGAILTLTQSATQTRARAVANVILSTFAGAAVGSAALTFAGSVSRSYLIFACLVGGAGAGVIVSAVIRAVVTRIDKIGGQ